MQEGMIREAQAVYASAVRAGVDKRPAWLMLTTQLFEHSEAPGVGLVWRCGGGGGRGEGME